MPEPSAEWLPVSLCGSEPCVSGADALTLVGALAGTLYAMTRQPRLGWWLRSLHIVGIAVLACAATWFVAENLPVLARVLGMGALELVRSRMLLAWLIAYFAQDVLLPMLQSLVAAAGARCMNRFGGPG